ncbi:uncharacterized protein LOC134180261 [Corticium candelabrum]|uniref:uncharacterized protein LOC134180261 n=1 Tax=Corticium candelabrum TaxID=121492 RepID=UPI002E277409|nr:uncharacterized protein LOC134180261 [Corticium candelabrum]
MWCYVTSHARCSNITNKTQEVYSFLQVYNFQKIPFVETIAYKCSIRVASVSERQESTELFVYVKDTEFYPEKMQATAIVLSILYLLVTPIKSTANSCITSDNQHNTVLLTISPISRLITPAQPGSTSYSNYCGESRSLRKRSDEVGVVRVNDCYEGIYPSMCDYNSNRIPSEILMADCGKCGSNDNRSRRLARCIKYINGKAVRGHWQPIAMKISLPFKTSMTSSNDYQFMTQQISYACDCKTTE